MNVFFSLLAIYFIYKIAEELYDNSGILAAILAAVFPSYNVWSGCVLSDTALAAVAIYYAIKYMKERKKKYLIITTVMCAVSTTQIYSVAYLHFGGCSCCMRSKLSNKEVIYFFMVLCKRRI